MIVLVSLIVLLKGFPCFHDFSHGASLHPYSMIFPHFSWFARINTAIILRARIKRICAHAYMRSAAPLSRVSFVEEIIH